MDIVHHLLQHYGYGGIFLLILVDNINIPMPPTELVLSLAGWYIARGDLSFWPTFLTATIAGTLGCLIFYGAVRFGHQKLLPFLEKYGLLNPTKMHKAEQFFLKYGSYAIFLGRTIPGFRTISLIPAGLSRYPVLKLTLLLFAGTTVWTLALLLVGKGAHHGLIH